jgi:hypothetical protein
MPRQLVFILCALFLAACGVANEPVIQTTSTAAATYTATTIATPSATAESIALATLPVAMPTLPQDPPTQTPTVDPATIASVIQSSLAIQPLDSVGGHTKRKITGWGYGFSNFEWVDENHILARTAISQKDPYIGNIYYPAMINLDTVKIWMPKLTVETINSIRYQSYWSAKLNSLISTNLLPNQNMIIEIYDQDGNLKKFYEGELTSISPSKTKVMIGFNTWLDLITGKAVSFRWQLRPMEGMDNVGTIWSTDEMRVFKCCYFYGNARTGENFRFETSDLPFASDASFPFGAWMLNDTYFLPEYGAGGGAFAGLFNPANRTIRNLNQTENDICSWVAFPDKRHVWMSCDSGSYSIDVGTFNVQTYPDSVEFTQSWWSPDQWSSDGKFAVDDRLEYILSVEKKELKPISDDDFSNYSCKWHPTENKLFCVAIDNQAAQTRAKECDKAVPEASCSSNYGEPILIFEAQTGSVFQKSTSPAQIQEFIWSPDGKRIAVLARDCSLWQIEYPNLQSWEQLAPVVPELIDGYRCLYDNLKWSPDGTFLSFNDYLEYGSMFLDIYIVDTRVAPK